MAFNTATFSGITSNKTDLYTSPENVTTVAFNGFISNKSDINDAYITLTYTTPTGTVITLMNQVSVPVGSSILLPKKVIEPLGTLSLKTDSNTNGLIDVSLELLTV